MAKQTGIIRLKGTLGDINFYSSKNGGDLARAAGGGFNSNDIKNKSTMVRTRENASEFGHCSTVKKTFRIALAPFLCIRKDGTLHGRMMTLFTKFKALDSVSTRGNRRVARGLESTEGMELMRNFAFTPSCNVMEVLAVYGNYNFNFQTLTITKFDIKNVKFPTGATHITLTLGILHFNFDTLEYQLKYSAPFYLDKNFNETSFEIESGIPELEGMALGVLGMKFYQEVGNKYYLFRSANAVGVEVLGFVS